MKTVSLCSLIVLFYAFSCSAQISNIESPSTLISMLRKSNSDTSRLNLLLRLSRAHLSLRERIPKSLDTALYYAQEADSLSRFLKNTGREGDVYLLLSEISGAKPDGKTKERYYADKAVSFFRTKGTKRKLAEGYIRLASSYESYDTPLVTKIRLIETAYEIYRTEKDYEHEAWVLKELGPLLMSQGKMEEGLKKLQESLAMYKKIGFKPIQDVYSMIGVAYTQLGNFKEGLNYGLMAVKRAEVLQDTSESTGMIYNYVSITYTMIKEHQKAEEYLRKALRIAEQGQNIRLVMLLANNVATALLWQHKPKEALSFLQGIVERYPDPKDLFTSLQIYSRMLGISLQLKEYGNASIYNRELLKASFSFPKNSPDQSIAYPVIIRYYFETGQYDKAREFLVPLKEIAETTGIIESLRDVHLRWFQVDSAQRNYLSAIRHFGLYKRYHDPLYNNSKSKEIAELHIQYETEKKEKDIQLLIAQDLHQKVELQQASMLRNVTFGAITLLLIIIALLYSRYSLKQKSNAMLQTQQQEIRAKNNSLQHLLDEKEWLLKEIHHRVKNNLQTVMSLLNSQSAYYNDDAIVSAIQDSQHRVHAMSMIHQKLYNSESLSEINMPGYILELVEYMRDCFKLGQRIHFETKIEQLELDVSQAVPLGLILNEAITNAIKHALPDNMDGKIDIWLQNTHNNHYLLTISDNGVGIPAGFNTTKTGSLGMSLMKGLSEDLDGTFAIESKNGTVLNISFVHDVSIKRVGGVFQPEVGA